MIRLDLNIPETPLALKKTDPLLLRISDPLNAHILAVITPDNTLSDWTAPASPYMSYGKPFRSPLSQ